MKTHEEILAEFETMDAANKEATEKAAAANAAEFEAVAAANKAAFEKARAEAAAAAAVFAKAAGQKPAK